MTLGYEAVVFDQVMSFLQPTVTMSQPYEILCFIYDLFFLINMLKLRVSRTQVTAKKYWQILIRIFLTCSAIYSSYKQEMPDEAMRHYLWCANTIPQR